jgi:hybrid cluster-associated redox disulfide protein
MGWYRFPKVWISKLTAQAQSKHAAGVFFVICASAKTDVHNPGIFGDMDTGMFDLQLTVDQILQRWPQTFSVFMKNKTKCVGCFMQQFCTLKDVAATYELPLEKLIDEIKKVSDEGM